MSTVIQDAPAALMRASLSLPRGDTIAQTRGAYDGVMSEVDFGGQWFTLSLMTPVLRPAEAAAVHAWVMLIRQPGVVGRIDLGDALGRFGTASVETATLSAAGTAGDAEIALEGLDGTLDAGSYVSIADRPYYVLGATEGGLAIWPRLRAAYPSGEVVQLGAGRRGLWKPVGLPPHEWAFDRLGQLSPAIAIEFREAPPLEEPAA